MCARLEIQPPGEGVSEARALSSDRRMSKLPVPAIVFADIDSAPPAALFNGGDRQAVLLERLAIRRVTLVLCSRRTRAEVESIRQDLGIFHPFVCENGAAAFMPERYFGSDLENTRKVGGYQAIEFGSPYEQVVDTLRRVADRLSLRVLGFRDMSVEQVSREYGLSLLEARLAKLREYSEPFRLLSANPVAEHRLLKALGAAGLTCVTLGPFHHAGTVPGAGPAAAVLTTLYRVAFGTIVTAVVGDGVLSADIARRVDLRLETPARGPTDWLESIFQDIDHIREARLSGPAARYAR
jgi:mannosyl-3-phosphoglycerate phosphatase